MIIEVTLGSGGVVTAIYELDWMIVEALAVNKGGVLQVDIRINLCTLTSKAQMLLVFSGIGTIAFMLLEQMHKGKLLGQPVCLTSDHQWWVDDLSFFKYLSPFCFLSIEFYCTFSNS